MVHIHALHGVDLSVQVGEVVTLIGANGAGKSTLMMAIFGQPRASGGRVVFDGEDITGLPTHEIARRGIALVPEGRRIFPRMTVMENLQMGAVLGEETNFEVDLKRMYSLFPILEERCTQRAGTLSGGEQQMLAIARALMSRPQLLLLDEPSLGLAPLYIKKIFQIVRELNRDHGMTILLVEQNAHHALRVAHRGYVLQHGQIILSGTGKELLANPEVHAAYLEGGHAAPAAQPVGLKLTAEWRPRSCEQGAAALAAVRRSRHRAAGHFVRRHAGAHRAGFRSAVADHCHPAPRAGGAADYAGRPLAVGLGAALTEPAAGAADLAGAGFFLALHFATWISSLEYTSVASSTALVTTNLLWIGIASFVLFGDRYRAA
jgi:branched-chain amino acid transport system ATP-binding protein